MKLITNISMALKFINEYGIKEFINKVINKLLMIFSGIRIKSIFKKIRKLHSDKKINEIVIIYYNNKINDRIKKILKDFLHKNKAILYLINSVNNNIYFGFKEICNYINNISINSFIYNIKILNILKSINNKLFFLIFPSSDFYNISAYLRKYNFQIVYIIQDTRDYEKELEENIILVADVVISLSSKSSFDYLRNDIIYINSDENYGRIFDRRIKRKKTVQGVL